MAGFIRRFTSQPSIENLAEIEAVNIVDLPPQAPTTGVGTGSLLIVGEFEDGPFAAGGDSAHFNSADRDKGPREVFGSEDLTTRFGGFGYTYGSSRYQNPSARRHLFELWNGNGFLKLKFCKPRRLVVARVDTSVGEVALLPRASLTGGEGPFALTPGDTLSITTDTGGPVDSTAIAATAASHTGSAPIVSTGFVGGEQIDITVDQNPTVRVTFQATDSTAAAVVSRINAALGYTGASHAADIVTLVGIQRGTGGRLTLANVGTGTALAAMFLTGGTYSGTGNVANVDAVTAAEVAAIVSGTVGLGAINAEGGVDADGRVVLYRANAAGTIRVAAGAMATACGFTTAVTATVDGHAGGTIAAGTRVRTAGGAEWVTMQTLTIEAAEVGPFRVKVRPANDNGSGPTAAANTVTTLVDRPGFSFFEVTNPEPLSAAKTEPQMDVAYEAAFDRTINMRDVSLREVNFSISARRSDAVARKGRQNAIDASADGMFGRKFIMSAPLGATQAQAQENVALYRSERVFFTWPGWRVRVPEIADVGIAGGEGFTADGVITVRGDAPLATINCRLNPEENPGQDTNGLIDEFFDVEQTSVPLKMSNYIALKAAGICAPRVDPYVGSIYQSGVTSELAAGLTTQARRKMADFIQDSLARALLPFAKKLATPGRRDGIRAIIDSFLAELLSADNPENARIAGYLVDERSGQTPELTARGIFVFIIKVRTLSSLDAIVLQTEIGEGVVTFQESA